MKCAAHTEAETSLRCGKCGKLICPRCMVQTPVGARCAECARVRPIPTYKVTALYYVRAIGAGLAAAALSAVVWSLIDSMIPFLCLDLILAGAFGYAIGELIGLATNRKRGRGLAILGGVCFALAYAPRLLVQVYFHIGMQSIVFALFALAIGVYTAVSRLR